MPMGINRMNQVAVPPRRLTGVLHQQSEVAGEAVLLGVLGVPGDVGPGAAEAPLGERFGGRERIATSGSKPNKPPEPEPLLYPLSALPHVLGNLLLGPAALDEQPRQFLVAAGK